MRTADATRAELWLEASQYLYREAALLDERRYREWLELFTDDATYWVPQAGGEDPKRLVSISYDDRRRLEERVLRLEGGFAFAQDPPSRTCRVVGNVVLDDTGEGAEQEEGDLPVSSNLMVAELRRAEQTVYAGRVEHRLVREDGGDGNLRIRRKVIRLINSDAPLGNLSFLL